MGKRRWDERFSVPQMLANGDGKTSASGVIGSMLGVVGMGGFIAGVTEFFISAESDIMTQSVVVITIAAGLLGYRKAKDPSPGEADEFDPTVDRPRKPKKPIAGKPDYLDNVDKPGEGSQSEATSGEDEE